ncbi:MAG TPA: hypothetical protein VKT82_22470 [Ktedonobacterales bacterium]|nr:hypothetical protein [Ktedonobacterales bacterium]
MQQRVPEMVPVNRVGTWCHWGALIIVILGVVQLLILIAQNQSLLPILGLISGTIFSALILYAVGTIVKYHVGARP